MLQVSNAQKERKRSPQADSGDDKRCAACREDKPKGQMLRFVADAAGKLLWDPHERAPGRGMRVCAERACLQKRKLWTPELQASVLAAVLDELGLYMRQHRVVIGADSVQAAIKAGETALVLCTEDAALRTRRHVREAVVAENSQRGDAAEWVRAMKALAEQPVGDDRRGRPVRKGAQAEILLVFLACTMQRLGRALGRDSVGVVALAAKAGASMKDGSLAARAYLLRVSGESQNE